MSAQAPEAPAAPAKRTRQFLADVEEFVYMTDFCGFGMEEAARSMGRSVEACHRYRKYLAEENPRLRSYVLWRYRPRGAAGGK